MRPVVRLLDRERATTLEQSLHTERAARNEQGALMYIGIGTLLLIIILIIIFT